MSEDYLDKYNINENDIAFIQKISNNYNKFIWRKINNNTYETTVQIRMPSSQYDKFTMCVYRYTTSEKDMGMTSLIHNFGIRIYKDGKKYYMKEEYCLNLHSENLALKTLFYNVDLYYHPNENSKLDINIDAKYLIDNMII